MRIVFFGNGQLGLDVLKWLQRGRRDEVVALVLNAAAKRRIGPELVRAARLPKSRLIDGATLRDPATWQRIADWKPDIGVSVLFGHLIPRDGLAVFPRGCINLHPAFLPYNRGANPNVWSLVEGTPAGTTLHLLDEGLDTGPILLQERVSVDPTDTGASLYAKLMDASLALFKKGWPKVRAGSVRPRPQRGKGTFHKASDFEQGRRIDPKRRYTAKEFVDLVRAFTFPPHDGAYLERDGRKFFIRLQVSPGDPTVTKR